MIREHASMEVLSAVLTIVLVVLFFGAIVLSIAWLLVVAIQYAWGS